MSVTLQFPGKIAKTEVEGFFLSENGSFVKVYTKVATKENTQAFYDKIFHKPVIGAWIQKKRIRYVWKSKKSV